MLSFDFSKIAARAPVLDFGELRLRAAELEDYPEWLTLRCDSRAHLTRWEPEWRNEDMTLEAFRARLKGYERQHRGGAGLSLYVCLKKTGALVGGVTLSDIRHHSSCSATLGYWIGEKYLRRGYGLAAVKALMRYAFAEMRLNRIEAACQPGNVASRGLLAKAGFREEGFARDYLFINGGWRDHILLARTARDYCGSPARLDRPVNQ